MRVAHVAVVLLNWNDQEQAERCLDAVRASRGAEVDVLIVDNGSAGDDVPRLMERVGEHRVLSLPENRGYAGGMNAGLRFWRDEGGGAPVLILTPDAALPPDALTRLVGELDATPEAGVVGPVVVYSRTTGRVGAGGVVEPAAVRAPLLGVAQRQEPYDVDWIDGCCMLVRSEALAAVPDGFDERFFAYFEETDLCGRVREAGWRIRVVPDAFVDHPKSEGTLPPYYFYYMVRNSYLFWRKNFGTSPVRVAIRVAEDTARSWGAFARAVLVPSRRAEWRARLRDARLQLRGAWAGTVDYLRGRFGPMPETRMPRA